MLYIHRSTCISPQQTFMDVDLSVRHQPVEKQLRVIEPVYTGIPPGTLRRMSKSVRIGVGAALPLLKQAPDGIIIGTANAGMEDCFHFLKQMVDYDEGLLTPGSFVQSTPNALAAQLGMMGPYRGYNSTHVHYGLAFENALLDTLMLVHEHPERQYLLGAVDTISTYNYNINILSGWYRNEPEDTRNLYDKKSPGSIAGEGAAMFWVSGKSEGAVAKVEAVGTLHSEDVAEVEMYLKIFLEKNIPAGDRVDLLISGENGDERLQPYYDACEKSLNGSTAVVRYKHLCGEYPTASAMAVWLAGQFLQNGSVPESLLKSGTPGDVRRVLIYNSYKGGQHGLLVVGLL